MAAGLPVVLTDLPVFAEYLRFGEDALAVTPATTRRSPTRSATLASDHAVRTMLRDRGREVAARYDWDTTARQHVAIYDALTAGGRPYRHPPSRPAPPDLPPP